MDSEQLSEADNKARLRWGHLAAGRMDRQRGDGEVTVTTEKLHFLCFLLTKSRSVFMFACCWVAANSLRCGLLRYSALGE